MLDVEAIRKEYPILSRTVHGRPLVYLDNGATTQLPVPVLNAVEEQYRAYQANIHRGIHWLSEQSTARTEAVRKTVAGFLGAAEPEEIIFTGGVTQSVNMLARSFSDGLLREGDVVVTTEMEHHSDLIPWQEACRRTGAKLRIVHTTDSGELDMAELVRYLDEHPKLVAVTCVSNVLGTVNPVREIIAMAHDAGAAVSLDAAQAMRHGPIRVRELDCDFLCFSGHKMMAPTGTGVLYGKRAWLERLPPALFGGGMVDEVTCEHAGYGELPFKFEAGTQNIAGIIGLGAAVEYLRGVGLSDIYR
ncbi:MAG: aminotransferase class V-fold PLP-dependent enzyme, partial [Oscillospiraceae bacterium]|nr:aminotransferase class V-fold PLP-dependent enzyme [Oscillospiraceae bacterium]